MLADRILADRMLADRIGVLPILDAQAALYLACGLLALLFLRTPARPDSPGRAA